MAVLVGRDQAPLPYLDAAHYNNPAVDDLSCHAATEVDETRRRETFRQIQAIVGADLPAVALVTIPTVVVKAGAAPVLGEQGYRIACAQFSTGLEVNKAVAFDEIDANMMQHSAYLKAYNERNGTDLVGIVQVPTPPMGLYSRNHKTLSAVRPGATVAVPNDPVNLARAGFVLDARQDVTAP